MIPYVSSGDQPTATQLNALASELDAMYSCHFANKTPLIYGNGEICNTKRFALFGTQASWKVIPRLNTLASYWLPYDHSTYVSAAAAMVVASSDPSLQLAYVNADPWPLQGSLEAHTVSIGGVQHFYTQILPGGVVGYRERFRRLEVLEVILEAVGGSFTWPANYNKYHFIRFHNLDPNVTVVTLPGGSTITLEAFGVQAVRRTYPNVNEWNTSHRYFWAPIAGDSLFLNSESKNNVASLAFVQNAISGIASIDPATGIATNAASLDPSKVWNAQDRLPALLDGSTPLYRLKYHPGRMLSWESASGVTVDPIPHDFSPTWSDLQSGINGVKWDTATLSLVPASGAVTPVDVIGLESNLTPAYPVQLPYNIESGGLPVIECFGIHPAGTTSSTASYNTGSPPTPGNTVTVTTSQQRFDFTALTQGAASLRDTLATASTFVSSDPVGELTTPTPTVLSDGWRVVVCGQQTIPASYGVVPDDLFLKDCDVSLSGFTQYYGGDLLDRGDSTKGTWRQVGRSISDYVGYTDAFGDVFYRGHPDLSGQYGLAGGIDWDESRGANVDSVLKRDDPLATNIVGTLTSPVWPVQDSAEAIAANGNSPTWYLSNRTRLLAGVPTLAESQTLVRYPLLADHYNWAAQLINSVRAIIPRTIDDVLYYGGSNGLNDGTWVAGAYPVSYYCAVSYPGVATSLGLTVSIMSGYPYLSFDTVKLWAHSLGLRFNRRRLSGIVRYSAGSYVRTRDTSNPYRIDHGNSSWVGRCCQNTSSAYIIPPDSSYPTAYEEFIHVERSVDYGPPLPSGWQWTMDDAVMLTPIKWVNYSNDPLLYGPPTEYLNAVSAYGPVGPSSQLIWASSVDGYIVDQPTLCSLVGWSGDSRAPVAMQLVNRWLVRRV